MPLSAEELQETNRDYDRLLAAFQLMDRGLDDLLQESSLNNTMLKQILENHKRDIPGIIESITDYKNQLETLTEEETKKHLAFFNEKIAEIETSIEQMGVSNLTSAPDEMAGGVVSEPIYVENIPKDEDIPPSSSEEEPAINEPVEAIDNTPQWQTIENLQWDFSLSQDEIEQQFDKLIDVIPATLHASFHTMKNSVLNFLKNPNNGTYNDALTDLNIFNNQLAHHLDPAIPLDPKNTTNIVYDQIGLAMKEHLDHVKQQEITHSQLEQFVNAVTAAIRTPSVDSLAAISKMAVEIIDNTSDPNLAKSWNDLKDAVNQHLSDRSNATHKQKLINEIHYFFYANNTKLSAASHALKNDLIGLVDTPSPTLPRKVLNDLNTALQLLNKQATPRDALNQAANEFRRIHEALPDDTDASVKTLFENVKKAFELPRATENDKATSQRAVRDALNQLNQSLSMNTRMEINQANATRSRMTEDALQKFTNEIDVSLKTHENLTEDFYTILQELEQLQAELSQTFKLEDEALKLPLERLISIFELSGTSSHLTTPPQLQKTLNAIANLHGQIKTAIMDKYKNLNSHDEDLLNQFRDKTVDAYYNLREREGLVAPLQAEYHYIAGNEDDYKANSQTIIAEKFPNSSMLNTANELGSPKPPPSFMEGIDANHYRIGKMANGAIITDRINKKGCVVTELVAVPPSLNPEAMWAKAYSLLKAGNANYIFSEEQFKKIYEHVHKIAKSEGRDITKDDIQTFLKVNGVENPNQTANQIFTAFSTYYKPYHDGKEAVPNDELIKIVIQQVESRRQMDPTSPIILTNAYSAAYAHTVELYCKAVGYDFKNESDYNKKAVSKSSANAFLKLIESNPSYGYKGQHKLTKIAAQDLPDLTPPQESRRSGPGM